MSARSPKSEFDAWFRSQRGPPPARTQVEITDALRSAEHLVATLKRSLRDSQNYDLARTYALYAWQAARKAGEDKP